MDAAADYQTASRLLSSPLPAYVSYVVDSVSGFDALRMHDTTKIVVRLSDGQIVAGRKPKMQISTGRSYDGDVLRHGPFMPACYAPTGATLTTFEARPAEAIALRPVCREKSADRSDDTDFGTLYVDPASHEPLAVTGANDERYVTARLAEHFTQAAGHVVPADFHVKVAGSGPMFWLNVDARETFSEYRFMDSL